jgi:hypothetical protein
MVLGLAVGRYFLALARCEKAILVPYTFVGEGYKDQDFPWSEPAFPWADILKPTKTIPDVVASTVKAFSLPERNKEQSPLHWLWDQAIQEWQ